MTPPSGPASPRRRSRLPGWAPLAGLWIAAGLGLSALTGRVDDWFVMTDELLYERFAISSARALSPLAMLHGRVVASLDQLYPLLIAPFYRDGLVPADLHRAHLFNAWLMSSACIPAFLLARRATGSRRAGYVLALASVLIPWIFYASFLLTEVAAYPAFVWALLAMQQASAAPSRRNDLLALAGLALAFFARTQFIVLAGVLPVAIVLLELGLARRGSPAIGVARALRDSVGRHRTLALAYLLAAGAALVLAALGRLGSALGRYRGTLGGAIPHGVASGLLEHLATLALGVGILPGVVGLAWLGARIRSPSPDRERQAFACLGTVALAGVLLQVTIFDLRLGIGAVVYDRYLFYLAPVLLLAVFCALAESARLRLSLLLAGLVVAGGFALNAPPAFEWHQFATLSPDAPISVLYRPLVRVAHGLGAARGTLVEATALLSGLYALGGWRFGGRRATVAVVVVALVAMPAEGAYVLERLFATAGWSGRPLSGHSQAGLDWVDAAVGTHADVAIVPYPVSADYFFNQSTWRDIEFWNKSVDRNVAYRASRAFDYTGTSFPRVALRIDPLTGATNVSPAPWVAQSISETRFRIGGFPDVEQQGILLLEAGSSWRAAWVSFGLDDDGWTRPGVEARVRLFPAAGQTRPETRSLLFEIHPPAGVARRRVALNSNLERWRGTASSSAELQETIPVCVPAHGFTDVTVAARGSSTIPPDLAVPGGAPRRGGVAIDEILLEAKVGRPCGGSGAR